MKILLTGSTGFLGSYIHKILQEKEKKIFTLARSSRCSISHDLTQGLINLPKVNLVVHNAGKAHFIPKNQKEKKEFFRVNLDGTRNLLKSFLPDNLPDTFIFISTVAVYGREKGTLISEEAPLEGTSAYAKSKIKAEQAVQEWGKQHDVNIVILRLPLVAGENAPGNLGAMIKAIKKGYYFRIGDGMCRRSIVLATDIGRLIPHLRGENGIFNLTDGENPTIFELEEYIAQSLSCNIRSIPHQIAKFMARVGDFVPYSPINTPKFEKLTQTLTFSDQKARKELDWVPRRSIGNFIIS